MNRLKILTAIRNTLASIGVCGFVLLLGSLGAADTDTIPFGRACVQAAIGLLAFGGGLLGAIIAGNEIDYIRRRQ